METEKRQRGDSLATIRGGGQSPPLVGQCLSFYNCRQLLVRSLGTKLTCVGYNHKETSIKSNSRQTLHDTWRHVRDSYEYNMETRLKTPGRTDQAIQ